MNRLQRCLFAALILLTAIVALQYAQNRALQQQINNYVEEADDRTDAPQHLEIRHAGNLTCGCRGEVCVCR